MLPPETSPAPAVERPPHPVVHRYEAPTLTGKKALEAVTLFSFTCTPGSPGCNAGHP